MTRFLQGFTEELTKTAGLLGGALKKGVGLAAKHPMMALGAASLAGLTAVQAAKQYKSGIATNERPRYLAAGPEGPSPAFNTNYHNLYEHEFSPEQKRELSWNAPASERG